MSLISRNIIRTLVQGSQLAGKGLHTTSAVNADKNSKEGRIKCTLIPGDGVGPELVYSVQEVFKAAGIPVDFESFFFSEVNPTLSAPLEDVVNSIARNKICIKGILATPDFSHTGELQTLNMKLRNALDLYANVVHVKSLPNVNCRHKDVDCIIIREQTEGEYSALEHESVPGVVECLKIITAVKSDRIAKFAFDYAVKMGRKKVTAVHKANIMKLGDGTFLRSCEQMAKLYPRIEFEKMIVDNCTMQMVSNPNQFDVMVTPNLYGNIVDNLASGLVGGAGVVAGASYSPECVVFEQGARHIFSGAVGKNIANPCAMLLCSANLLAHVNLHSYSKMIKNAINKVLMDGKVRTKDLGGQSTTKDFTYAIIHSLTPPPQ
ncbi:isocitrate dehydrogenase [NAD] subunit beta, mitochondrial isoform X2 [Leguminivora glycinivorella]|uniref:isocitrate dehydrogenase [NAD] subunit beta, mitochondrial isoform X2 n=1 Tax=Leguminivora glycinivorella TaxID=1035111 RepID=UPI00200E57F1|nr:isocitrate dehydrogenase [NAD] subunit beta, mitochondrial isoform X2 [Leguminivora glycinivorella]